MKIQGIAIIAIHEYRNHALNMRIKIQTINNWGQVVINGSPVL
jgi:hypothetical protein